MSDLPELPASPPAPLAPLAPPAPADVVPLAADATPPPESDSSETASAAEGSDTTSATEAAGPASAANLSPAACAALLAQHFPALFGAGRALPIKLRIQADIQARVPGVFSKKSLAIFLHRYTTSTAYLKALGTAPHRVDLDGAAAGDVAEEHRAAALQEVERRRALFDERRQAERDLANEARRAAAEQARKERNAQQAARHAAHNHAAADAARQRAVLLRAFETTTLTPANFCALKGLVEADLQAQLTLARQEREQRPLEPARPPRPSSPSQGHREDSRGPRRDDRGPRSSPGAGPHGAPRHAKAGGRPPR
jgi:ProP effector